MKKIKVAVLVAVVLLVVGRNGYLASKNWQEARRVDACVEASMRSGVSEVQSYKDCAK